MTLHTAAPSTATRGRTITLALALAAGFLFLLAVNATGALAADPPAKASIEQCRNGALATPHKCDYTLEWPDPWDTGALNGQNAHYFEGEAIPYRTLFENLSTVEAGDKNLYTVTVNYDSSKDGKHAFDYLTTYNRTETDANPCTAGSNQGDATIPDCSLSSFSQMGIPADPHVTAAGVPQGGDFTLFGGTIEAVGIPDRTGDFNGTSNTSVAVTFRATQPNPVLAWGGHLSSRSDWNGPASASISGAPYHMSIPLFSGGNQGNRDRAVNSTALYLPASLTIVKDAQPDSAKAFAFKTTGGGLSDFTLVDDGVSRPAAQRTDRKEFVIKSFGSKTVTEDAEADWDLDSITCTGDSSRSVDTATRRATLDIQEGDTNECTFVNKRKTGTLRVVKAVTNDDGGKLGPDDFRLHVKDGGADVAGSPDIGKVYTLPTGTYGVSEDKVGGYALTGFSGDCTEDAADSSTASVTVVHNREVTCTLTNDDIAPELTVKKVVVNDDGGDRAPGDFTMNVTGTSVSDDSFPGDAAGTPVTLDAGAYSVDEAAATGYAKSLSPECAGTIDVGDKVVCTITNDDIAPRLTVTKTVIGGNATAGDFTMLVTNANPSSASFPGDAAGTPVTLRAGAYSVDEAATGPAGYTKSLSGECSGTIAVGETKACTVTNTRDADPVVVTEEPKQDPAPLQISGTPVTPLAPAQQQVKSQVVAGPRARRGKARLQSPTGCRSSAFKARVSGREIRSVTFTVDGKRIARLSKANANGAYVLAIRPSAHRYGTHRIAARVQFTKASRTKATTLRRTFLRCARPAARPQFTG